MQGSKSKPMDTIKIQDINDLVAFHDGVSNALFQCFRGQSDASWGLVPSFYRGVQDFSPPPDDVDDGSWMSRVERDVYREFDRIGRRYAPKSWEFNDPWHRIILAQHFGVPTRLLDWTKNIFVACYFAVSNHLDRDAAIYCLNITDFPFPPLLGRRIDNGGYRITALNSCTDRDRLSFLLEMSKFAVYTNATVLASPPEAIPSDQSGIPNHEGFLVLLEPPVIEDRIHAQKSLFMVYVSYNEYDFVWEHRSYIEAVEQHHGKSLLTKLIIPQNTKHRLLGALKNNWIDVDDIFPDLPGLVMRMQKQRQEKFDFHTLERANWYKTT